MAYLWPRKAAQRRPRQPVTAWQWAVTLGAGLIGLLLFAPLLTLLIEGIALRGWEGAQDVGIEAAIALSLLTTCLSGVLIALLGTPLAYVLARWRFPLRGLVGVLAELPIVLPPAVAGLALLITFGRRGPLGGVLAEAGINLTFSTTAVVMAQVFVAAPFFIRTAQVGFRGISKEIEDAARVDGADGLTLFRMITLPLSAHALGAGLALSWARALGEFGATILFAGNLPGRTQTMPLLVYSVFERDIGAAIWAGVLLAGLAFIALLGSRWLMRSDPTALS